MSEPAVESMEGGGESAAGRWRGVDWLWLAVLVVLLVVGAYYRVRDFADLALLDDEHHAVTSARDHTLAECFTFYQVAHNTVPLTMYARLLIENLRLNEFTLRLPMVISSLVLMLLVPLLLVRRHGRPTVLVATALVASSPSLIYFAFQARPYPVTMLLLMAGFLGWDAWARGSRKGAMVFAALSALAVFTHVFAAFFVVGLYLVTLVGWRAGTFARRDVLAAAIVTGVLVGLLVGPGLPNLIAAGSADIGAGKAEPGWVLDIFELLSGHLGGTTGLLCIAWLVGVVHTCRRELLFGLTGVVVPACQVLGVLAIAPQGFATAWARYVLVAWPVVLVFVAVGLVVIVGWLVRHRHRGALKLGAVALIALIVVVRLPALHAVWPAGPWVLSPLHGFGALFVYAVVVVDAWIGHDRQDGAGGRRVAATSLVLLAALLGVGVLTLSPIRLFARDPDTFRVTRRAQRPDRPQPKKIPSAYLRIALDPTAGDTVLECPEPHRKASLEWVPYGEYQRFHGKQVVMVHTRQTPRRDAYGNLRTVISLEDPAKIAASGARYLVVHLDYEAELDRFKVPVRPNRKVDFDRQVRRARLLLGRRWGPPVYVGEGVAVYDLGAPGPREGVRPTAPPVSEGPWKDLGGSTAGLRGPPRLVLGGPLTPKSTLELSLTQAAPNAPAVLFISTAAQPIERFGGTLHALPPDTTAILTTDALGMLDGVARFGGAPSGTRLWFQVAVYDKSIRRHAFVLSNGVVGTVP